MEGAFYLTIEDPVRYRGQVNAFCHGRSPALGMSFYNYPADYDVTWMIIFLNKKLLCFSVFLFLLKYI